MQTVKLHALTGNKMELIAMNNKVPALLSSYIITGAKNKVATGSFGSIVVAEMQTELYLLTVINFFLVVPCTIELIIREPLIELDFALEGAILLKSFRRIMPQGQFNAFYDPGHKRTCEFLRAGNYRLLTIYFKKDPFSVFTTHYRMVSNFIKTVKLGKEARMGALECYADFKVQMFVKDILNCGKANNVNIQWLNTRIDYLLLFLIERLNVSHQTVKRTAMLYDSDRILKAAESLIMEPQSLEHLPEIARKWQVNPQRLKNEFKRLIRMPVYAFKTKLRMEQARQQLMETNKSVQEIALSLGYSSAAYFSRVFKMHMGDSPRHFRKEASQLPNVALRSEAGVVSK